MASYRPMTVADLAAYLLRTVDEKTRWKIFWEFLEEYRWEAQDAQAALLRDEPALGRRRTLGRLAGSPG
jgi:hypothetical protein